MEKSALIAALLEGENISKDTYIFCYEHKNIDGNVGYTKFEVLDYKQRPIFNFKIMVDPTAPQSQKDFASLQPGTSRPVVGLVHLESKNFLQKFKEGLEAAVTEGRIPYLPSV